MRADLMVKLHRLSPQEWAALAGELLSAVKLDDVTLAAFEGSLSTEARRVVVAWLMYPTKEVPPCAASDAKG